MDPGKSRKKREPLPTAQAEGEERHKMDEVLREWFEARCRPQNEQIAELVRTVRGFNGTPGLMERMIRMETVQLQQGVLLSEMHAVVMELAQKKPAEAEKEPKKPAEEEAQVLTKGKLALMAWENLKPILVALVAWALLTFFPELMGHVWGP